jgi:hypothetical protein
MTGFRWIAGLAGLAATLGAGAAAAAARPLEPEAFTAEMARRIGREAPALGIAVAGPLSLRMTAGPAAGAQLNLDRVAAVCAEGSAADCEAMKARFIAGALGMGAADTSVTRDQLRVAVRSSDYADGVQQRLAQRGKTLLRRPIGEGLEAILIADFAASASLLDRSALEPLGLAEAEAFEAGRRNVLSRLPDPPSADEIDGEGKMIVLSGDTHEASLLLSDKWARLARATGDRLVVLVPDDSRLIVGTASGPSELARFRQLAANDYRTAHRGISPDVLRWSEKGWVKAR